MRCIECDETRACPRFPKTAEEFERWARDHDINYWRIPNGEWLEYVLVRPYRPKHRDIYLWPFGTTEPRVFDRPGEDGFEKVITYKPKWATDAKAVKAWIEGRHIHHYET